MLRTLVGTHGSKARKTTCYGNVSYLEHTLRDMMDSLNTKRGSVGFALEKLQMFLSILRAFPIFMIGFSLTQNMRASFKAQTLLVF